MTRYRLLSKVTDRSFLFTNSHVPFFLTQNVSRDDRNQRV